MDTKQVRQFVKVTDGRIGVVIANETSGGVFRGHCDMWFGNFNNDGTPLVEQLLVTNDWKEIRAPLGILPENKSD